MNRREAMRRVQEMRLPLTALERIELVELMFMDAFKKAEKRSALHLLIDRSHSFDASNEMAFEGAQITRGMRMMYGTDATTNARDLTNYYLTT